MAERARIKWFSRGKGYGFLEGSGGQDVFVHFSEFRMPEAALEDLEKGTEVEFDLVAGIQGPRAANVVRITRPLNVNRDA